MNVSVLGLSYKCFTLIVSWRKRSSDDRIKIICAPNVWKVLVSQFSISSLILFPNKTASESINHRSGVACK